MEQSDDLLLAFPLPKSLNTFENGQIFLRISSLNSFKSLRKLFKCGFQSLNRLIYRNILSH